MPLAANARYARALADVVFAERSAADPDRVLAELRSFARTLGSSPALRDVLASPAVSLERKRTVIESLAERLELAPVVQNFLLVTARHRRLGALNAIGDAFQMSIDQRRGVVPAEVTFALEPDADQRARVEARVSELTGKKPRCEYRVDPAILGGGILRIGSSVYDGSVDGQLRRIGAKLTAGA